MAVWEALRRLVALCVQPYGRKPRVALQQAQHRVGVQGALEALVRKSCWGEHRNDTLQNHCQLRFADVIEPQQRAERRAVDQTLELSGVD